MQLSISHCHSGNSKLFRPEIYAVHVYDQRMQKAFIGRATVRHIDKPGKQTASATGEGKSHHRRIPQQAERPCWASQRVVGGARHVRALTLDRGGSEIRSGRIEFSSLRMLLRSDLALICDPKRKASAL
ncbi:hypothetical protein HPB48_017367 [Haemaphysalis longicornis]|uniref:Uncharacterized protein n=1 Tax=Haemaphysalis longicornis TaxID=44386 RepID=A0A9J6GA32_HAELO|nr:hypothetical protein HPB48_017367 [Haemaphysalis longicornis]